MLVPPALRYCAIVAGTVLWDAGAVLQKAAVDRMPGPRLGVGRLISSPRWMTGLAVTAAGWGLYVFGLQAVGVAAARTVTGGSYIVLAVFSIVFLRVRLRLSEWIAVGLVTAGILLLGRTESASATPLPPGADTGILVGIAVVTGLCVVLLVLLHSIPPRSRRVFPLVAFASVSGLLSSVGDLMVKILTSAPAPVVLAGCGAALVAFYLAGFSMLSRAYRSGTMVAAVVLSDFSARLGTLVLGGAALGEPVAGLGAAGVARAGGFLLVLGGSLLLGRFGAAGARDRA